MGIIRLAYCASAFSPDKNVTMEALLAHSHLLDATLGRAAAYMAVALMIGLTLWQVHHVSAYSGRRWRISAGVLGWAGALMVLHGILAEQSEPFQTPGSMGEAVIKPEQVIQLLGYTSTGRWWILYLLLLTVTVSLMDSRLLSRPLWLRVSLLSGLLICLAATAHAGEQGMMTWMLWLDVVHMGLALTWLGSLLVMAVSRLSGQHPFTWAHLRDWSFLALPLFLAALLTGSLRLYAQYAENGHLAWAYLGVWLIKVAAIGGVMVAAFYLRHLLRDEQEDSARYDHYLSYELFSAFMLILATALLTQLPSW